MQHSPFSSLPPQMQLAAGQGAEPGGRLLTPLALLLAATGLCLSFYSARRMAGPPSPPQSIEEGAVGLQGRSQGGTRVPLARWPPH